MVAFVELEFRALKLESRAFKLEFEAVESGISKVLNSAAPLSTPSNGTFKIARLL